MALPGGNHSCGKRAGPYLNGNLDYTSGVIDTCRTMVSKTLDDWDATAAAREVKNQQRIATATIATRAQIVGMIDQEKRQHDLFANLNLEMAANSARLT